MNSPIQHYNDLSMRPLLWQQFSTDMAKELGEDLTLKLLTPLREQSQDDIVRASEIYAKVGELWAPLMLHWRDWIISNAENAPKLLMRDCKPLAVLPTSDAWPQLHLNRAILGIGDEIAKTKDARLSEYDRALAQQYMRQEGLVNQPNTLVDTGCWGTLVKNMRDSFQLTIQPLFFFSHNPHIRGMLNEIGLSEREGEILNDSLECSFPNLNQRAERFVSINARVEADVRHGAPLSRIFGLAVLQRLQATAYNLDPAKLPPPRECAQMLLEKSAEARAGVFTGILPENTPSWSQGAAFLVNWDKTAPTKTATHKSRLQNA